ncbi:hypothetical protein ACEPAF_3113 [Sanghuangporus sanghuang]
MTVEKPGRVKRCTQGSRRDWQYCNIVNIDLSELIANPDLLQTIVSEFDRSRSVSFAEHSVGFLSKLKELEDAEELDIPSLEERLASMRQWFEQLHKPRKMEPSMRLRFPAILEALGLDHFFNANSTSRLMTNEELGCYVDLIRGIEYRCRRLELTNRQESRFSCSHVCKTTWRCVLHEPYKEDNGILGLCIHKNFNVELHLFYADKSYNVTDFEQTFRISRTEDTLRLARCLFNYRDNKMGPKDKFGKQLTDLLGLKKTALKFRRKVLQVKGRLHYCSQSSYRLCVQAKLASILQSNILRDPITRTARFDSSMVLPSDGNCKVRGVSGTRGYTVPEVELEEGHNCYNAYMYLADAWKSGIVLAQFVEDVGHCKEKESIREISRALRRNMDERWTIRRAVGAWEN